PEVDHRLLGARPEVLGLRLERCEHRRPVLLVPEAILVGVKAEAIAVPGAEGDRVGSPHEVPTDPEYALHVAILSGRPPAIRVPWRVGRGRRSWDTRTGPGRPPADQGDAVDESPSTPA